MGEPVTGALQDALATLGVRAGQLLVVHADLTRLGPAGAPLPAEAALETLRLAVGPEGTLVFPTYTFSFCRGEDFDVESTPTMGGPWSPSADLLELARTRPGAIRSRDPIHSVVALGPAAGVLLADLPPTCFGPDSVFARLRQAGAGICLLGLPLEEATIRHHVEEELGVPFRFRKLFTGTIREHGQAYHTGWVYSVRILADAGIPDGSRLEAAARSEGVCRSVEVGQVEVLFTGAAELCALAERGLRRDPWWTARGPAGDPVQLEAARVAAPPPVVTLPRSATMGQMVDGLWRLRRDIVSDGYDAALAALADQVPMTIHEYPTGTEAWTWLVPEKWTCHEARLETEDGEVLFSAAEDPLHVVSYSLPFEGVVGREELLRHLHVHPTLPRATPFIFKYYERDWGLCCARELRDRLTAPRYRVVIRTSFSFGTLKVGEVVVPGTSDESFVLCAHLCHPGMVNDDLSGVVVGVDVMRRLLAGPAPRLTIRLLIVPETIGTVAHLGAHPELLPRIRGGLFLEMLGRAHPHVLQQSFAGDTELDACFRRTLERAEPAAWTAPFRTLAGNDERQYNAPGVRIPMLVLSRQLQPGHPEFPYREYHSSEDVPAHVPPGALEASRDLVLRLLTDLDALRLPRNRFQGEVFCSRFGIHVDPQVDPEGNRALFDIMFLVDGTRSAASIADVLAVPESSVQRVLDQLEAKGLIAWVGW